jgi:hypothetical protein
MEDNKHKIPTHDPYTGELNPYYEELTGEKNPLLVDRKETDSCFDLKQLVGKKFRYNGKYGLSTWTDEVKNVGTIMGIKTNLELPIKLYKEGEEQKKFEVLGYTYHLMVRSTRANQIYEFEKCIFIND